MATSPRTLATWNQRQEDGFASPDELAVDAAIDGSYYLLRGLLDHKGASPDAARTYGGQSKTLLMITAEKGHLRCLELLLERGASVNFVEAASGYLALHYACASGHADIVNRLLACSAIDVFATSHHWKGAKRPSQLALEAGFLELARTVTEREHAHVLRWSRRDADVQPLIRAIAAGADASTPRLMPQGWAPLHLAVVGEANDVLRVLLAVAGIVVDVMDSAGRTPLALACARGHVAACRRLLARGAATEAAPGDGLTPLLLAAQHDRARCFEALLRAGASPRARRLADGLPALHIACAQNSVECVLVWLGAPVLADAPTQPDIIAVDLRFRRGNGDGSDLLREMSVGVSDRAGPDGMTALACAAERGAESCVRAILDAMRAAITALSAEGCRVTARDLQDLLMVADRRGKTAKDLAMANGHDTCAVALLEAEMI